MNNDSLGRVVKVRVYATTFGNFGSGGGAPIIDYANGYTEFSSTDPTQPEGFRIKGKNVLTQPTIGFHTNNITFSIYNLGPDSRALFQSKVGTKIEIFAGYQNNVKQIALGDILWAKTYKAGPLFVTDVIAADSHFALVNGQMNTSFKGPTSYMRVITALTDALSVNGIFVAVLKGVPDGSYLYGIVLNKSPFEHLSEICQKLGLSFHVYGGGIYILPLLQDTGAPSFILNEDTGLVEIPEIQPPGLIGVVASGVPVTPDIDLSFTHLLRSDLVMSQRVTIQSKFINGDYVLGRVVQEFDSWSGPFYSKCDAFKLVSQGSTGVSNG
jgi:hypothetical protein